MIKIKKIMERFHAKASEKYVDAVFSYESGHIYEISVPTEYRRTGILIEDSDLDQYLLKIYDEVDPQKWDSWKKEQKEFWAAKPGAGITKSFFDVLSQNFDWCCVTCTLPQNPNWARRTQDIKEFGYTLSTHTKKHCSKCNKNTTQLLLIPIKRGDTSGYETWTPTLRNKIMTLLGTFDSYEGKVTKKEGLLPDHKFPEIRWDLETRRHSLEDLSDDELKNDFQLLSNQRNQQKREVCRNCAQTGVRGVIYGIPYFYEGGPDWDNTIPKTGKDAEKGCRGCGWYDINKWRSELTKKLNSSD